MTQQTTAYDKPIPLKNLDNAPYWDAADRHELALQHCTPCQQYFNPAGPACPRCGSTDITWQTIGNEVYGKVISYITSYRPFLPGFQNDVPLVIAVVQLDDIPEVTILANIIEYDAQQVKIGLPVAMTWVDITEDRALPQWIVREGV